MSYTTKGTPSSVSWSYSYSGEKSPSRGEVLNMLQEMRETLQSGDDLEKLEQAISSYTEIMGVIVNLQIKLEDLSSSFSDLFNSSHAVVRAIEDKGSHPEYHEKILEQHKSEWPYLWQRLGTLCKIFNKEMSKSL
jgi:hypothetical protein